ncbi:hypothetical protein ACJJTC_006271 [Scirpophaga incertulas]
MKSDMILCTIVCFFGYLLVLTKATRVEVTQVWKPNFGWEITCSWYLFSNDSLQSVKLSQDNQQFMIFRPEKQYGDLNKKQSWNLAEKYLNVICQEDDERGITGKCVFTVEPRTPPKRDFSFNCVVSGEGPRFLVDEGDTYVEAWVPPSEAEMTVTKQAESVSLNCSASGLPAPSLIWTVDNQMVPHNFHGTPIWNATSKLWSVWSTFTPLKDNKGTVECSPQVAKDKQLVKGQSALYNDARIPTGYFGTITVVFLLSILLR